jgi:hypothetical protein
VRPQHRGELSIERVSPRAETPLRERVPRVLAGDEIVNCLSHRCAIHEFLTGDVEPAPMARHASREFAARVAGPIALAGQFADPALQERIPRGLPGRFERTVAIDYRKDVVGWRCRCQPRKHDGRIHPVNAGAGDDEIEWRAVQWRGFRGTVDPSNVVDVPRLQRCRHAQHCSRRVDCGYRFERTRQAAGDLAGTAAEIEKPAAMRGECDELRIERGGVVRTVRVAVSDVGVLECLTGSRAFAQRRHAAYAALSRSPTLKRDGSGL